jgi:nitrite reductase/ring-hydroxylating ferredoxin subunit
MTEAQWIDLGPIVNFPDDIHSCITAGDQSVVVMNAGGTIYAIQNRCPHAGLPIGDGERSGLTLTCPYHGYTYNIKTGKNIDAPHDETPVKTYPVRIESGRVSIRLTHDNKDEA